MTLASVFRALVIIKKESEIAKPWKFHYFGPNVDVVTKEIVAWGLEDKVVIHGNIPRS